MNAEEPGRQRNQLAAVTANEPVQVEEKIAPRPHWLTITLTVVFGLLSPSFAGIAIWLSWNSLDTAQRSMQIGQRAYLVSRPSFNYTFGESVEGRFAMRGILEIENLGNTPATEIVPIFSTPKEMPGSEVRFDHPPARLGPRQTSKVRYQFLTAREWSRAFEGDVCVVLQYLDAFGSRQESDNVCVSLHEFPDNRSPYLKK